MDEFQKTYQRLLKIAKQVELLDKETFSARELDLLIEIKYEIEDTIEVKRRFVKVGQE